MKKILLTLLCVFSLTFAYTQIDTFKTVKVDIPSHVVVRTDSIKSVYVPDTTISKYLNIHVCDGTLYINYLKQYYHELLKEPIKLRISTPDSVNIITSRHYIIKR